MAVQAVPTGRESNRLQALLRLSHSDRVASVALGTAGIAAAICLLELMTKSGFVASRDLPPAFDIIARLCRNLATSHFWGVVGETLYQFAIGLAIAVLIAVPLGVAVGANDLLWRALRPTIEFFRPVPPVAFLALLLLLYGPSSKSAIILVVLGSVWAILIQAIYGMRDRDEVMLETARSLGLGWWQRVHSVTLPSILPYLVTGMRLGIAYALIAAISAEILVSSPGLGAEAWLDIENGATTLAYSYILAAGLLGVALHVIAVSLEARALRWSPSRRGERR
jgi:ABC-type nitrate/sulfonate/bicarbonate transport system permease component